MNRLFGPEAVNWFGRPTMKSARPAPTADPLKLKVPGLRTFASEVDFQYAALPPNAN